MQKGICQYKEIGWITSHFWHPLISNIFLSFKSYNLKTEFPTLVGTDLVGLLAIINLPLNESIMIKYFLLVSWNLLTSHAPTNPLNCVWRQQVLLELVGWLETSRRVLVFRYMGYDMMPVLAGAQVLMAWTPYDKKFYKGYAFWWATQRCFVFDAIILEKLPLLMALTPFHLG